MGPRPGLVHANDKTVQTSPTLYFVSEDSPTRCFVVCAFSGDHAKSVIAEEFDDFRPFDARVMRLQRGLGEEPSVLDCWELADRNQPQNQTTTGAP